MKFFAVFRNPHTICHFYRNIEHRHMYCSEYPFPGQVSFCDIPDMCI